MSSRVICLRAIFEKGPKFRQPRTVSWQKNYEIIKNAVHHCLEKWATRLRVPQVVLQEWVTTVLSKVRMKIDSLSRKGSQRVTKSVFSNKAVQQSLKDLHEKYDRKHGSTSYIVREVHSVRERERYRERERERERERKTEVTSPLSR